MEDLVERLKTVNIVSMNIRPNINLNPPMDSVNATLSVKTWVNDRYRIDTFNISGSTVEEVMQKSEQINNLPYLTEDH